jgi:hypothetical protein
MGVMQKREVHVRSAPSDIGSQQQIRERVDTVAVELEVEPKLRFWLKAAVLANAPRRDVAQIEQRFDSNHLRVLQRPTREQPDGSCRESFP